MGRRLLPFEIMLVVSAEVSMFAPLVNRVQPALNTGVQVLPKQMTAWTKPTTTSLARGSLRDLVHEAPPDPRTRLAPPASRSSAKSPSPDHPELVNLPRLRVKTDPGFRTGRAGCTPGRCALEP